MLWQKSRIALSFLCLLACTTKDGRWTQHAPSGAGPAGSEAEGYKVMFYNVGGLFHPTDDPDKEDDAYTPDGEYEWTQKRYRTKLRRIAEVISMADPSVPELIGLCEIENAQVLGDLVKKIEGAGLGFLHHESRDPRGIDLGLLYDPESFDPFHKKAHPVRNPGSGRSSRPILSIGLESNNGDTLRCFLAHWPSRAGGKAETEPARTNASRVLQKSLDRLFKEHPERKVLIMGDLNDHPDDPSIQNLLKSGEQRLRDLMAPMHAKGLGTYNYQGEWGVLDHFILSEALEESRSELSYKPESARIIRKEKLLYFDEGANTERPDKYMKRGRYYGGYSDHLPILMELEPASGRN